MCLCTLQCLSGRREKLLLVTQEVVKFREVLGESGRCLCRHNSVACWTTTVEEQQQMKGSAFPRLHPLSQTGSCGLGLLWAITTSSIAICVL